MSKLNKISTKETKSCQIKRFDLQSFAVPPINNSSVEDQSLTFLQEDVIVSEILLRLHIKSLYKFKCVSKLYKSIISHPKFAKNYMQRAYSSPKSLSSSGLLSTFLFPFTVLSPTQNVFSKNVTNLTDTINSSNDDNQDPLSISINTVSLPYNGNHRIMASSNGLILSIFNTDDYAKSIERFTLCVSNPLTKKSVKLPHYRALSDELDYDIVTRRDQATDFSTYKIVAIGSLNPKAQTHSYKTTIVSIFSSDTGSWVTWEASFPEKVDRLPPIEACFGHKGTLYFLDDHDEFILTYNPYDNPDRFDRILLPTNKFSKSSLFYSGDKETVKCYGSGVGKQLSAWRLVNGFEWCLDVEFRVSPLLDKCKRLMVAPNPWNRNVICHPYVVNNKVTVVNPRTETWKSVNVFTNCTLVPYFSKTTLKNPLINVQLCPWSSPFHAQN